jgi:predicted enzyme related to lactoylglutathione lyase
MTMEHLDGNAAAGDLSEVFAPDVTTAIATCAACGVTGSVAQAMVYETGMGTVLRCPACDAVLLRVARGGGQVRMEMRGVRVLRWRSAAR